MTDQSSKWTEMFVAFLRSCFLDFSLECQLQFWEAVGNKPYARLHKQLNPLDKEIGFNGVLLINWFNVFCKHFDHPRFLTCFYLLVGFPDALDKDPVFVGDFVWKNVENGIQDGLRNRTKGHRNEVNLQIH